MALFSNKKYFKPGKGVEKDEPEKHAFFKFFELFFRKFWKYLEVNLAYFLILLPIILYIYAAVYDASYYLLSDMGFTQEEIETVWTPLLYSATLYISRVPSYIRNVLLLVSALAYGPVKCGVTYVLRNFSSEHHSWISDIWDKARENWKYGMLFGIVDILAVLIVVFNFSYSAAGQGILKVSRYITLLLLLLYCFMRRYIYLMIVTVDLDLRSLLINAWLLSFVGIFRNVGSMLLNALLWLGSYLLILLLLPIAEAILLPCLLLSLTNFIAVFACYPMVDQYLVQAMENLTEEEKAALQAQQEEKQAKLEEKKAKKASKKKRSKKDKFNNYYD